MQTTSENCALLPSADPLLDTSAAIALVSEDHARHIDLQRVCRGLTLGLAGHALVETYSVLTRMPGGARMTARAAARLIEHEFPTSIALTDDLARSAPAILAAAGVAGGAVYDGIVGLAARSASRTLFSCDRRAASTYAALGVYFRLV